MDTPSGFTLSAWIRVVDLEQWLGQVHMSIRMCMHISIHMSIHMCVHMSIHMSIYLSRYMSEHVFATVLDRWIGVWVLHYGRQATSKPELFLAQS